MEKYIFAIIANIALAFVFSWLHEKYNYRGTRWVLVTLTIILPFIGIIYFIVLSILRAFGKKSAPEQTTEVSDVVS